MSGKRFNPLEDPPTASSSDEDDVENSNVEEEENDGSSSSEEEEDESSRNPSVKNPQTALIVPEKQISEAQSESEEESDSETERKEAVANPGSSLVKSVTEIKDSVVKNQNSKKGESSGKSETKRSRETDERGGASGDVKKVKRFSEEETKKNPFRRIWSEDDEILVLQSAIDYKTDSGVSPYDDMDEFYQLVKISIGFDATKLQLKEKLRNLKKKYNNNLGKLTKGEEPTFSSAHDRKVFELSKVIWGADGMAVETAVKSNEKSEKKLKSKKVESEKKLKSKKVESVKQGPVPSMPNGKNHEDEVTNREEASSLGGITESDAFVKSFLVKSLARYGVDDLAAQQGWSRLASEDKKRFEEQWKTLQLKEFELYSQKSGFVHEVLKKMAEAFGSIP